MFAQAPQFVNQRPRYRDREEAADQLIDALRPHLNGDGLILAIPRGAVPMGARIAHALGATLDIVLVRKLGAPYNPEYGLGAIDEDGLVTLGSRQGGPLIDLRDRVVIVVDDGLATGFTAVAAVHAVRTQAARSVIVAVPVGSAEAVRRLRQVADEVICLAMPPDFQAVGQWYDDFSPVTDDTVRRLLESTGRSRSFDVKIPLPTGTGPVVRLPGRLDIPHGARGLVVFAHGSGSSRRSPRNQRVATILAGGSLATLLFDLLARHEDEDRDLVFDVARLGTRLLHAIDWVREHDAVRGLPLGLFGASTGAAAALVAAAESPAVVQSVVSRGGRPDLAADWLPRVTAPTLLVVGGRDIDVLRLNRWAAQRLGGPHEVAVVDHATHLFEEPGALEQVAGLAKAWFARTLGVSARAG